MSHDINETFNRTTTVYDREEVDSSAYPQSGGLQRAIFSIKDQIKQAESKQDFISMIYRETLQSMLTLFGKLAYMDSDNSLVPVKCIHANQERTVAKLKQENNIILPIISVSQTTTENNDRRNRYESILLNASLWDKKKQRAFRVVSFPPRAVNIMYNVNIWAKYKSDLDQVMEQIRFKFNPDEIIDTKFNDRTRGFITSETDDSVLRTGDKEDRILRKSLMISVETYIPSPQYLITSTGKIERFEVETHTVKC